MVSTAARAGLFRARSEHGHHRVTFIELFFDLVFVFAVTQLSHGLAAHFTAQGLLETGLLTLSVWWVWIYTSWVTNWLDPDRWPVRLMLFGMMIAGLGLSTSIPQAFTSRGLVFAGAYVAMQVGRTLFMLAALPAGHALRTTFTGILSWLVLAGVFWIAGGAKQGSARLGLWAAALLIEYLAPFARYWTPWLGAARVEDWNVEGAHLAERCGLFIIIALGEGILVTGDTFAHGSWTLEVAAAFAVAFAGSAAMWWIYFDRSAELGVEHITRAKLPGAVGRLAYTYLHLPIVAGIVLAAVGDEMVLAHPDAAVGAKATSSVVGGPFAYLVGAILFKHVLRGWYPLSHLTAIGLLGVLAVFATHFTVLTLAALTAAVLVMVSIWETISFRNEPRH